MTSRLLMGVAVAAGIIVGGGHAALAQWDDYPMGPGMMGPGLGPGMEHPVCDPDGQGMWPGMGPYPGHHDDMHPGCVGDDDWLDD